MKKILLIIVFVLVLTGCQKESKKAERYTGPFSKVNGSYAAIDDLGRELNTEISKAEKKYVGMFYFLWHGQHGTEGPYDITEIIKKDNKAYMSGEAWEKAGGGKETELHWWGKPLFGYYTSSDKWVLARHVQMLADADVDYLMIDVTNYHIYAERALDLLEILDSFYKQGIDVPKIAFYTFRESGLRMNQVYRQIYKAHPEYSHLWFNWEGKPLIVGYKNDNAIQSETKEFFTIMQTQFPTENGMKTTNGKPFNSKEFEWVYEEKYYEDAFPWIDFHDIPSVHLNDEGKPWLVNVSVAEIQDTNTSSNSAWWGAGNRTRSFHNGKNDTSKDAYLYGYNFARQFEYALEKDPQMIFITGWNEWVAMRYKGSYMWDQMGRFRYVTEKESMVFIDCCDINNSRDVEPMEGGYGDNYYMQMVDFIRRFKGTAARVDTGGDITINSLADFDKATAVYKDYTNDVSSRNSTGFVEYKADSGKNDFQIMKVIRDNEYIYFYVQTLGNIDVTSENTMTLFINTGNKDKNWYGYDYVINRQGYGNNRAIIEKCKGGWKWDKTGEVQSVVSANKMMLKVPKRMIGIDNNELIDIQFKWADSYIGDSLFSFYTCGDSAPYGRMNYVFSER